MANIEKIVDELSNLTVMEAAELSKALEEKRTENIIGSSLDADIIIYCSRDLYNTLNALNGELKFIFITSNQ